MIDIDALGRNHARTLEEHTVGEKPPPVDLLPTLRARPPHRFPSLLVVGLIAVVVAGSFLVISQSGAPPAGTEQPAVASPGETTVPSPSTTSANTLPPFDIDRFLDEKLLGSFAESADQIGVIVLVPSEEQDSYLERFESDLARLSEVAGYVMAQPHQVAAAAREFAARTGSADLAGRWIAIGLMPSFQSTATDEWVQRLGVGDVLIRAVGFTSFAESIPEGWAVIEELPFVVDSGSLVHGIEDGVVVVGAEATKVIESDGSVRTGPTAPFGSEVSLVGSGDHVVAIANPTADAWVLDVSAVRWRSIEQFPAESMRVGTWYVPLGWGSLNGQIVVVLQADRAVDAVSPAARLDVDSGTWQPLPDVPRGISVGGVTSDGDALYAAGVLQGSNNAIIGERWPILFRYTEAGGWEDKGIVPIDGQASTITWSEGTGLVAWNYDLESVAMDDGGTWTDLGLVTMREQECYPRSRPVDGGVGAWCGGLALLDEDGVWREVRSSGEARHGATSHEFLGLLLIERSRTLLISYDVLAD